MAAFVQRLTRGGIRLSLPKGLKEIISFLTIIPTGETGLNEAPDYIFLFPLIGIIIGVISGLVSLFFFHFLPNLVAATLTLGFLLLITGLHHTDGLIDFGDGLMTMGRASNKIQAMRDKTAGAGGSVTGFLVILVSIFAISHLGGSNTLMSLIICETSAKFSMVLGTRFGSSTRKGSNTRFIEAMKGAPGNMQLLISLSIIVFPVMWFSKLLGAFIIFGTIITTGIIVIISEFSFRGLTGDVFGAMNDFTRMFCLVILLIFL